MMLGTWLQPLLIWMLFLNIHLNDCTKHFASLMCTDSLICLTN
ncbi:hypothetical protein GLYMA_19G248500v4 [Glycine max]|nr:hypothetical protein GLYMA_19G248500v4 [Glycine max]